MIKHLFTLMWNRKKQNFLMITEIFFAFVVLFAVSSLAIYNLNNYNKPLGFEHGQVWSVNIGWDAQPAAEVRQTMLNLKQKIESYKAVEKVSFTSPNVPYSFYTSAGEIHYKNRRAQTHFFDAGEQFKEVMNLTLVQGRWFQKADAAAANPVAVINQKLAEELFPGESALGKITGSSEDKPKDRRKIIGVIDEYRYNGELAPSEGVLINPLDLTDTASALHGAMVIKVKPGAGGDLEEKILKDASQLAKGYTLELKSLAEMRRTKMKVTVIPIVIACVVCAFLIINVALGLFGVLWYNINRRISEIGLRRAIGAASGHVYKQFIGEVLVLAFFSILMGIIVAVQFPLLGVFQIDKIIYFAAIGFSGIFIFLLVALCAFYPSLQAAKITPATALHED